MIFPKQQIIFDNRPLRKSKKFYEKVFRTKELGGIRRFDILTETKREEDKKMSLDTFLRLSWRKSNIRLQINDPQESSIICVVAFDISRGEYPEVPYGKERASLFGWVISPFTFEHYEWYKKVTQECYGEDIIQ